jgi:hypothetical protein
VKMSNTSSLNQAEKTAAGKSAFAGDNEKVTLEDDVHRYPSFEQSSAYDILGQQDTDPALNKKMHIVNNV